MRRRTPTIRSATRSQGKSCTSCAEGRLRSIWTDRYYGTVDATPLFLVLLSELWRWTGDDGIVLELESAARRALDWIDSFGDRDGDGFVEYLRRASHGIDNQNWKDSYNSMVFHDGSLARAPIAPVEVQGYVYDAKLRMAELARRVWRDEATAARLEGEAAALRERFDAAFWLPERGWYALGLDAEKRPVDALASNMGHLLWSGIVPADRVAEVATKLVSGPLWSGWGVRTLAADEAAFDPLEYHNGTVWPHDNSLIALGLAQAGRRIEAERVVRALLDCAPFFEYRLPELFSGGERRRDEAPGVVPTSARPQAWAAGTPLLLLRAQLGLEPDPGSRTLRVTADDLRPGSKVSRSIASPPSDGTGACAWRITPPSSSRRRNWRSSSTSRYTLVEFQLPEPQARQKCFRRTDSGCLPSR